MCKDLISIQDAIELASYHIGKELTRSNMTYLLNYGKLKTYSCVFKESISKYFE